MCNAGYYKNESDCVKCTGNTVKSTEGDAASCPTVCNGMTKVPNSGHTACGKRERILSENKSAYQNVFFFVNHL